MYIAPYLFVLALVIIIPAILSTKFRWDEGWQISLWIAFAIPMVSSIISSFTQSMHIRYDKVDVEIAKTSRMVIVDWGTEYKSFNSVHDVKTINDSTTFYWDISVDFWGIEHREGPVYEIK
jgi:hypothetical protein